MNLISAITLEPQPSGWHGVAAEHPTDPAPILIVDDDPVKRLALRATLAPLGYPIVEAASGEEALRHVASEPFAVILMDVRMPDMDGYQSAGLIRRRPESRLTPIIFVTGYPKEDTETSRGYALGAVDYVFAPVAPEELRAKVEVFTNLFITTQQLRRSGRHFELSRDLACTIGYDGYVRQLNSAWEQTLGWSESELRSRPFVEFVHPDDREGSLQQAAKLADGAVTGSYVNRFATKDGAWRWLEWSAVSPREEELVYGSARDVSERMRADEAVRHLAAIVESSTDAVIGIVLDGTIVSWNPAAESMLGYSNDEAVGQPIAILVPAARDPDLPDMLARFSARGRVEPRETVRLHKNGHPVNVMLTISPVRDSAGELSGVSANLRDISAHKRTQRYLDAQHEATRVLADSATTEEALPRLLQVIGERMEWPVGTVWMPLAHDLSRALRCAAFWHEPGMELEDFETTTRLLRLAPGQGLPGGVWESQRPRWVPDVSLEPHSQRAAQAIQNGLHSCVLLPIVCGDKPMAVIELRSPEARPLDPGLLDVFGRLSSQVGHFLERKRSESALEASERRNRKILESAHDAFVSIDEDGLVTQWNPRAEVTFGWSPDEAMGRDLCEMIIPESLRESHRAGMQRFRDSGEGRVLDTPLELSGLHRDGHEFPIEITISALETPSGYSFNAFLRDITERTRSRDELAAARDEALEASKLKSAFVANVSHEIRTPMNGVIGMTGLLLDTELNDEQREYAETVCSSGEALLDVIDDILDFSKIEAGKLELDPTDFDLSAAIEKACGMLASNASERDLELVVEIDPELPARVKGDAPRIRQVMANLISNAIKFTAAGEVVVRAGAVRREGAVIVMRFEVSDTGIGIDAATLRTLFEPFSQADGSTTREYGGTGLGLAISKQLVELMGGQVGGESKPGAGSRFWFELALGAAAAGDHRAPQRELAGLRALVVDDNATTRLVLCRQLSAFDMSCDDAASASQAVLMLETATAAHRPYSLALLDMNMPGVDGYELARAIRARPALRDMRVVLLATTGRRPAGPDTVGVDAFLTKPVRQSRLYDEIQAVMEGEAAVAALASQRQAPPDSDSRGIEAPVVLVVEDTPVNQTVAVRMLEKCGFDADVAENGRFALAALARRSYSAVLMDCQMPELDGYDTTREIRRLEERGARTPIIAMTANSMRGDRERCLEAGMDDYLSKPLRTPALQETLTRWVVPVTEAAGPLSASIPEPGTAPAADPVILDGTVIADLENLDGDVLTELLRLYFDGASSQLAELEAALARGEASAVGRAAHKLKGSSATVGAARVSSIGRELEAQARAGELANAGELLQELHGAIEESRAAFRRLLAQSN